jgi:hypothetical protein
MDKGSHANLKRERFELPSKALDLTYSATLVSLYIGPYGLEL